MKKLITQRKWKDHIRRRQLAAEWKKSRPRPFYVEPKAKRGYQSIVAPERFSFLQNPEGMNEFFSSFRAVGRTMHILLDMRGVVFITPEAIAALLAMTKDMPDTIVRGNLPDEERAKQVLLESGLFEHVKSQVPLPNRKLGKMKQLRSKRVEPQTAKELIVCGTEQAFGQCAPCRATRASYATLIELMGNTHAHAAGKHEATKPWWASVYGDATRKRVCYCFLDTGVGIFRSVKLGAVKRAFRRLGFRKNAEILMDILQGRIESRTGLSYRGKGLPSIFKKYTSGDLKLLFILTNNVFADLDANDIRSLDTSFKGTLLYWECEES